MKKEGWIERELGTVCFTTSGGTPSRSVPEYYSGNIPWVKSGELNHNIIWDTEEHISDEAIKNSSAKIFPEGTLLIALYGATIGKLAILGVPATTNQAVCGIFQNELFEPKFLFNYLFFRKQKLIEQGTGGAQPNISQSILKKLPIPLAPLPEQRAIVAKIEQLFSALDNGIANLKAAKAKLDIYRQAVLKKAFEGELTRAWREKSGIVDKWRLVRFKDYGIWKGGGTPSKSNPAFWEDGSVSWVSPKDMKTKMILETQDNITVESIENSSAKWIEEGAILFVVRSGILRRTLPVAIAGKRLTVNQDLQAFLPGKALKSEYVYWYCISEERDIRIKCAKDGTTVESVESTLLKQYEIPLCSLAEQHQIVQEIESRLSVCDNILSNIDEGLEKAEALRQSILKKAFEGRLLSAGELAACRKEADWAPAGELLGRIRAAPPP